MADIVDNLLTLQGSDDAVRILTAWLKYEEYDFSFHRIKPEPEELCGDPPDDPVERKKQELENRRKFGSPDWVHWATVHWGTDLDAVWSECAGIMTWKFSPGAASIYFETHWTPPDRVIYFLAKQNPHLRITHEYSELDIRGEWGYWCRIYRKGGKTAFFRQSSSYVARAGSFRSIRGRLEAARCDLSAVKNLADQQELFILTPEVGAPCDLEPIRQATGLKKLHILGSRIIHFEAVASLPCLTDLRIDQWTPRIDLRCLSDSASLRSIALTSVPPDTAEKAPSRIGNARVQVTDSAFDFEFGP